STRQRNPYPRITRQPDGRKSFSREKGYLDAKRFGGLGGRLQGVDDTIDLGPPRVGCDQNPHQVAQECEFSLKTNQSPRFMRHLRDGPSGFVALLSLVSSRLNTTILTRAVTTCRKSCGPVSP